MAAAAVSRRSVEVSLIGGTGRFGGDFRDVQSAIRRCVLPNGEISDDASATLRRIRASITETRETIQKNLKQVLRARNAEAGEDYVTLRNDRFVIPVRAEHRRSLPGVVHGASATGQTVFMEPFETVEANNQLVQLAETKPRKSCGFARAHGKAANDPRAAPGGKWDHCGTR